MVSLQKYFDLHTQKGSPVVHSPYNIICSTVGRSTASVSDLGEHIYFGASYLGRIYRLWTSLPYYINYVYIRLDLETFNKNKQTKK